MQSDPCSQAMSFHLYFLLLDTQFLIFGGDGAPYCSVRQKVAPEIFCRFLGNAWNLKVKFTYQELLNNLPLQPCTVPLAQSHASPQITGTIHIQALQNISL